MHPTDPDDRSEATATDRFHPQPHPLAGTTVMLRSHPDDKNSGPVEFHLEDWQTRVYGKSWMYAVGNPAALKYAMRSAFAGLPTDNDVVYGHVGPFGHMVHVSELVLAGEGSTSDRSGASPDPT